MKIFTLSSVGCHAVICFLVATRTNNRRSNSPTNSPTNQQTAALSEGQTERRQAQLEANSGGENEFLFYTPKHRPVRPSVHSSRLIPHH